MGRKKKEGIEQQILCNMPVILGINWLLFWYSYNIFPANSRCKCFVFVFPFELLVSYIGKEIKA